MTVLRADNIEDRSGVGMVFATRNTREARVLRRTAVVRPLLAICLMPGFILLTSWRQAASGQAVGQASASSPLSLPAKQWAVDAAQNEIKVIQYGSPYLRYRVHIVDAKGDQVRDVIESKDGTVARLIYRDRRPLTPSEDAAEHDRLQNMIDSPSAFAAHIRGDASGKKMAVELLQMLPDAMIYTYAPGQPQRAGAAAGPSQDEIVVDFKPNAAWTPPTMTAGALTGLAGRAWIDPRTRHVTRLEGSIFRTVNFGWGVFAHIYPGGNLLLEQVKVADQRWIFSRFIEHLTLRALMVKTLKENADIQASSFTPIKEMNYQDAIHTLLSTQLPTQ